MNRAWMLSLCVGSLACTPSPAADDSAGTSESATSSDGPRTTVIEGSVPYSLTLTFEIAEASAPYYRVVPTP